MLMLFSELDALPQRRARPFGKDADGTLLAEGVGMLRAQRRRGRAA